MRRQAIDDRRQTTDGGARPVDIGAFLAPSALLGTARAARRKAYARGICKDAFLRASRRVSSPFGLSEGPSSCHCITGGGRSNFAPPPLGDAGGVGPSALSNFAVRGLRVRKYESASARSFFAHLAQRRRNSHSCGMAAQSKYDCQWRS